VQNKSTAEPSVIPSRYTLLLALVLLTGCDQDRAQPSETAPSLPAPEAASSEVSLEPAAGIQPSAASEELEGITGLLLEYTSGRDLWLQVSSGKTELLPDTSLNAVESAAANASDLLDWLNSIDRGALGHEEQLTVAIAERQLKQIIEAPQHYWLVFDATPYRAGLVFGSVLAPSLRGARLTSDEEIDSYLALVADVGRYVDDVLVKLRGQSELGIYFPKAAIPGTRELFGQVAKRLPAMTAVSENRISSLNVEQARRLNDGIESILNESVLPSFAKLLTYLGPEYMERAPESVGLSQYPGGQAAYQYLVRRETTLAMSPEEIHQHGLNELARIQAEMKSIRDGMGFNGSTRDFHDEMRGDARFYAKTPQDVENRFRKYINRIEPVLADYFKLLPKAPYGVKRLDPAGEAGMTFGNYETPSSVSEKGLYRYNGSQLDSRPMAWAGPLIYHELVPGHHFHLALTIENDALPIYRKQGHFVGSFNEGWANYAASLAHEMDLFNDPWDRYGWLLFESFITSRLVVDTGMNYFGWPLEKARAFMLENTFSSETEVATETLRYSTDIMAQALGYKLGYDHIWKIRRAMEKQYGNAFDIREFHAAVVGSGALPMDLLADHVAWYMAGNMN
jgi:uncharacterized protein (DUF885 family)